MAQDATDRDYIFMDRFSDSARHIDRRYKGDRAIACFRDETDETNNETWTIIDISRYATGFPLVEVVDEAPIIDP